MASYSENVGASSICLGALCLLLSLFGHRVVVSVLIGMLGYASGGGDALGLLEGFCGIVVVSSWRLGSARMPRGHGAILR
eukprot:scaffold285649_cov35-Attheya_sp.AAC.1